MSNSSSFMIHILSLVQIKKHNIGFYLYSLTLFIEYIHIVLKNKVPSLYLGFPLYIMILNGDIGMEEAMFLDSNNINFGGFGTMG